MKPRTILHTIETGGPGGAETVLLRLASSLDPARFRSLALVAWKGWLQERLEEAGVPTFVARGKAWYDFRAARTIRDLVRREGVDLIHSHLPGQNFSSCLGGRLAGCKAVCTYHGEIELGDARSPRGAIKLWFVRRNAAAVTVVADTMRQRLLALGMPPQKMVRIYNGIDVAVFQSAAPGHLRRELGVPADVPIVGTVANVRQSKGHDFFVRAARTVRERFAQARFVAVGEVPADRGEPLRQRVRELGLEDRFFFLGFRRDVPELLRDLDVFVLPSVSEGFPLVLLEAMASGRTVVATRSGGPEEVVEDGKTGLLVPAASTDALSAAIVRVLADRALAGELARNARALVETRYSLQQMLHQYQLLYERCLPPPAPA
ncbi:MAG: glycosyltransferase [Acidobacteria bacterium]|nr:glycosyltransferase [Acidobacteriota bacterium]